MDDSDLGTEADGDAIVARLNAVRAQIADAAAKAGRDPRSVALVAVSKTHGIRAVRRALAAGQRIFGENRVQEAASKFPQLRADYPDLVLHLIGPLQTNKVKEAVALFDVIETVDRPKLAEKLGQEMHRTGKRPHCYIQVNIGSEPQKAGVAPHDVSALLALSRDDYRLPIVGLMCIPPVDKDPAPYFTEMAALAKQHHLPILSQGMSGDFPAAIAAGATHVRVGTAIFGGRPKPA
ncbi:MAG TPA: YggS family pyridoxal phosphate-dependent enzyme [Alphaproteobacteria bacterium]|nr:YggS family pyridoxal phosphate-dependent enzyme [Alphaproteobacteria bacterium]